MNSSVGMQVQMMNDQKKQKDEVTNKKEEIETLKDKI
jgi:hypothetical protein